MPLSPLPVWITKLKEVKDNIAMNLKLVRWLIAHQEILLKVVAIAKKYSPTLPYIEQWAIADQIARVVIPVLQAELVTPHAMAADWDETTVDDAFALGAEVHALGVDWQMIVEVIIPILTAILHVLKESDH